MHISFTLDGPRGAKYRVLASQMGRDTGGGVLWEVQHYRTARGVSKWVTVASGKENSNDVASRLLAGWLTSPMPVTIINPQDMSEE